MPSVLKQFPANLSYYTSCWIGFIPYHKQRLLSACKTEWVCLSSEHLITDCGCWQHEVFQFAIGTMKSHKRVACFYLSSKEVVDWDHKVAKLCWCHAGLPLTDLKFSSYSIYKSQSLVAIRRVHVKATKSQWNSQHWKHNASLQGFHEKIFVNTAEFDATSATRRCFSYAKNNVV